MTNNKLKPLSYIIPLLLSFGGSEAFALEAEDYGERRKSAKFEQYHYLPQSILSGFYGTKRNNYGALEFMVPIAQRPDRLMFVDARGMFQRTPSKEFNLGGGYRWLNSDADTMYGLYAFFDRKKSVESQWFNQITLGGEYKFNNTSFGANLYIPVGTTTHTSQTNYAEARAFQADKFNIVYGDLIVTEYAMYGADIEIGYELPFLPGLTAYFAGYYFNHKNVEDAITGPRVSLSYDVAPYLGKYFKWVGSLDIEASAQYDDVRKDIFYTGIKLTVPLGHQAKRPTGIRKAMTAPIRRDIDVVIDSESAFNNQTTLTKSDGSAFVGKIISTKEELDAATTLGSGIDLIGVKGQISVPGIVHVDGAEDTAAAVNLLQGQSITGLTYTFTVNGKTYNTKIVNSKSGITGSDPSINTRGGLTLTGTSGEIGHLLKIYTEATGSVSKADTQRIEDLVLRVPEVSGSNQQYSAAITSLKGRITNYDGGDSFGDVVIDNVDTNSTIYMFLGDNRSGQITIKNSQISANNIDLNTGAGIHLNSVAETALTVLGITNNTFSITSSLEQTSAIRMNWLTGSITNNHFTNVESTSAVPGSVYGIYASEITSTANISNNTFDRISSAQNSAYGINVDGEMSGTISNNTFSNITGKTGAYGIYQGDNNTIFDAANVFGNSFNAFTNTLVNPVGISISSGNSSDLATLKANNSFGGDILDAYRVQKRQ